MSSPTWTPRAVASEAAPFRGEVWRAVEAQHIASTVALVDSIAEQHVLEALLEDGKPPVPAAARRLHYLLFTPFRYPPPPGGSRFRGDTDPGVFYAADEVRTACAELGYWRWRHLLDTPALTAMPARNQTVFRVSVAAPAIDLRRAPFVAARGRWMDPRDYGPCQGLARSAREAGVRAIRYASVRDPEHGACCAVLDASAFTRPVPLVEQTWVLSVFRERVTWQRSRVAGGESFEFATSSWHPAGPGARNAPALRGKRQAAAAP